MNGSDQAPIAIICGNGRLPIEVAEKLVERARPVILIGIEGEASKEIERFPFEWVRWGKIGRLFKLLRLHGAQEIVLAGGVIGRPELKLSMLDIGALRTLPGLLGAMLGGDDAILSGVVAAFEKNGFVVQPLAHVVPEMLVAAGPVTSAQPSRRHLAAMREGAAVTRALGVHDIGQACVVMGKRAVAVEGVEGTDGMLQRIADLREQGRLPTRRGGVLVKCAKPGQSDRADLPTIGPETIDRAAVAGLVGIGVEAGKALIVGRGELIEKAKQKDIFVFGLELER